VTTRKDVLRVQLEQIRKFLNNERTKRGGHSQGTVKRAIDKKHLILAELEYDEYRKRQFARAGV